MSSDEEVKSTEDKTEKLSANISLNELKLNNNDNVIVVLGGEASGVSNIIFKVSDYNVFIPPRLDPKLTNKHPFNLVDSLNVGVSAGIILSFIKNQILHLDNNHVSESSKESKSEGENKEVETTHKETKIDMPVNESIKTAEIKKDDDGDDYKFPKL